VSIETTQLEFGQRHFWCVFCFDKPCDADTYQDRIENVFATIKALKAIATPHDKTASSFTRTFIGLRGHRRTIDVRGPQHLMFVGAIFNSIRNLDQGMTWHFESPGTDESYCTSQVNFYRQ